VQRKGSRWTARLAGAEALFSGPGRTIRFSFPRGLGRFRGELARDGRSITGFWLQPASGPEEPGIGQAFASPLLLRSNAPGVFRGEVRPLEDRFTLFLRIFRDEEGRLTAAFRNPERNSRGGAAQFQVAREGDSVSFTARPDPARPDPARPEI